MAARHPRAWALAAALAVVAAAPVHARQETLLQASYEAAVIALQTEGSAAPAHRLGATWTHRQFEIAAARTRWESPRLARPASLLHLELALAAVESDPDEALWQIRLGDHLLEWVARAQPVPADDFVARWSVVASSVFLARTDPPRARAALAFGLRLRPRDSRVRQQAGVIEDLASLLTENDDTGLADRKGTEARRLTYRLIARAEREYREALALWPGNAPARIRLGRLLHRRDRLQDARADFERARAAVLSTGERYLLLLFLSSTYEAQGEAALARAALQECVRVAGNQQGAWLALAQFEERSGHPERARGVIAQGFVHGRRSDTDAWWDYRHGGFDSEGLEWLRGIARSSP